MAQKMFHRVVLLCLFLLGLDGAPTGLLCEFQKSPTLGVRAQPRFTWIIPPCAAGSDHQQVAYNLQVSSDEGHIWNSGKVAGNDSTYVMYSGPALNASTRYHWTVTTWTQNSGSGAPCQSAPSAPASFITALFDGWSASAQFLTLKGSTFAYFRKEVSVPVGVVNAAIFITAELEEPLLCNYKLFINGALADLGPGRGEASVWDGDGQFKNLPYATLDATHHFRSPGTAAMALQVMNSKGPGVIMQVKFHLRGGQVVTVATDATWLVFNADVHLQPGPPKHGSSSAGNGVLEYTDARREPVGWKLPGFKGPDWVPATAAPPTKDQLRNFKPKMEPPMQVIPEIAVRSIKSIPPIPIPPEGPVSCGIVPENSAITLACPGGDPILGVLFASFGIPGGHCPGNLTKNKNCDANGAQSIVETACVGKVSCSVVASNSVFGGDPCEGTPKALAVELKCGQAPTPTPQPIQPTSFLADFGREFQGGLRLAVGDGSAGQKVYITCGESLKGNDVGDTWGWEFDWTLRDGAQLLEQHKYMECRFVTLTFEGAAPSNFTLTAWKVHYKWDEQDTSFTSNDATLNAVWELSRYTLEASSLDTYTDSNTRERRPYEADGIIAATSRLLLQRDYLWNRHSHAWVIQYPTWPVEWQQLSPFLGWQDYMATGQPDLSLAFMDQMYERTQIGFLDSTGLLDTSNMGPHIVDWMPDTPEGDFTVELGEFTASNYTSVSNAFGAHGLDLLSQMMLAGGRPDNATRFAAAASSLKAAIVDKMWNGTAFCDGPCALVGGNSLVMTNMFTLCFGMIPSMHIPSVWATVKNWGLEEMGDYGAFWYQMALSSGYYAPLYDTPDDGSAVHKALTKCDNYSWCSGLRDDNLTMTRESWHAGTYSHAWGSSAIVGVAWGLMGIHQTSPAWATFVVKPKLGPLKQASIMIPTIRGYINVTASQNKVDVNVPCGSVATLCLPRTAYDVEFLTPKFTTLLLDGTEVMAVSSAGHMCAGVSVGCGSGGAPRSLRAEQRPV